MTHTLHPNPSNCESFCYNSPAIDLLQCQAILEGLKREWGWVTDFHPDLLNALALPKISKNLWAVNFQCSQFVIPNGLSLTNIDQLIYSLLRVSSLKPTTWLVYAIHRDALTTRTTSVYQNLALLVDLRSDCITIVPALAEHVNGSCCWDSKNGLDPLDTRGIMMFRLMPAC